MHYFKKTRINYKKENKTPQWLVDIQNKSWEPEIIISGITLTFLFILSDYSYNFHAMLVQDYAVYEVIAKMLYRVSIILLTGFKIVLIVHLILRGFWTALVGLSYVFPHGVKTQNLSKGNKGINYDIPETLVIKFEKICSLLFSFIFSTIIFVIGFYILYIPICLLFFIGLDIEIIRIITHYIILPLFFIIGLILVIFSNKIKKSKLKPILRILFLDLILTIYFTNIGKFKTSLMYIAYFLFIYLISFSDFSKFEFKNKNSADTSSVKIVHLNKDHYQAWRNRNLRIPKAIIDQFRVTDNSAELFISFFKEDIYTIKQLENNPILLKTFNIDSNSTEISLADLYKITIDDIEVSGLRWYSTNDIYTNQRGIITSIPLNNTPDGYHILKLDKIHCNVDEKDTKLINHWEIIPFETGNKTNTTLKNNILEKLGY